MKPPLLGQDSERNEYWLFKEDLTKIYVRLAATNTWAQYDDEASVVQLEQSLSTRGIREKKLQEQIKKHKSKLKYKKKKADQ